MIGGGTRDPAATRDASRSSSGAVMDSWKFTPVTPAVARQGGELPGVAGHVDQHVDAIRVRARDGVRQRHRRAVNRLGGSVAPHPFDLGCRGDGVHVRAGLRGELGQERADSVGRTDDQHDLAVQRRQRVRNCHRGDARGGQRGSSDRVQAGRYSRQRGALAAGHVL